jgi:hypothetical protein
LSAKVFCPAVAAWCSFAQQVRSSKLRLARACFD